jgi:hypothetical protein
MCSVSRALCEERPVFFLGRYKPTYGAPLPVLRLNLNTSFLPLSLFISATKKEASAKKPLL